jgi:hypothetical protein
LSEHLNLSAYDNVESLENFSENQFKKYCDDKIKTCQKHLHFFNTLSLSKKFNICEIGSGNSKLLYALEKNNMINSALGIEISKSRFLFAEKFKNYMNSKKVKNLNENIFNIQPNKKFDLIIGVDIVLQLIAPIHKDAETNLLKWVYENLQLGGYVVFELCSFSKIIKQLELENNSLNIWTEFPLSDPFKYILSNISFDENQNLDWNKKFIKRNSMDESTFKNIIKPYTPEQITDALTKVGFSDIKIQNHWHIENDCDEEEFIVIAKKQRL